MSNPIIVVVGGTSTGATEYTDDLPEGAIFVDDISDAYERLIETRGPSDDLFPDGLFGHMSPKEYHLKITLREHTEIKEIPYLSFRPERDWENGSRRRMKPRKRK